MLNKSSKLGSNKIQSMLLMRWLKDIVSVFRCNLPVASLKAIQPKVNFYARPFNKILWNSLSLNSVSKPIQTSIPEIKAIGIAVPIINPF